jgi:sugar phosphate isomerase/epimerase
MDRVKVNRVFLDADRDAGWTPPAFPTPRKTCHTPYKDSLTMKSILTRRRFLVDAGLLCGTVAWAARFGRTAFAGEAAVDMPTSCVDGMLRNIGQKDCWSALNAVGAEGIQADIGDNLSLPNLFNEKSPYTLTPEGIVRLAADAKAANQRITAFCMHNNFDGRPEVEAKWCIELAQVAKTMNVPVIRIDVVPQKSTRPEFLKLAVKTLSKVIEATESTGTKFAVENHSNTTNDPTFLRALFDGVGSKRLGLTLDIGNFYWFGHPLSRIYEFCEEFASRVYHTHCKNIRYPAEEREKQRQMGWKYDVFGCPIDQGDVDYRRVVATLYKAGYRHDMCIENEFLAKHPAAEAQKILAKEIQLLKDARAACSNY